MQSSGGETGANRDEAALTVPVFQGETRISDAPDEMMTTILGSCIAACVWDERAAIGGMNHFLLPGSTQNSGSSLRYGVNAMELLINGLLSKGAQRSRLKVKLFGGAKMFDGGKEIGVENAKFAEWFMQNEGFDVVSRCLGGQRGRKIRFWPTTGRVQRAFMSDVRDVPPVKPVVIKEGMDKGLGDINLF